jgi:hypothetical protein
MANTKKPVTIRPAGARCMCCGNTDLAGSGSVDAGTLEWYCRRCDVFTPDAVALPRHADR